MRVRSQLLVYPNTLFVGQVCLTVDVCSAVPGACISCTNYPSVWPVADAEADPLMLIMHHDVYDEKTAS